MVSHIVIAVDNAIGYETHRILSHRPYTLAVVEIETKSLDLLHMGISKSLKN